MHKKQKGRLEICKDRIAEHIGVRVCAFQGHWPKICAHARVTVKLAE